MIRQRRWTWRKYDRRTLVNYWTEPVRNNARRFAKRHLFFCLLGLAAFAIVFVSIANSHINNEEAFRHNYESGKTAEPKQVDHAPKDGHSRSHNEPKPHKIHFKYHTELKYGPAQADTPVLSRERRATDGNGTDANSTFAPTDLSDVTMVMVVDTNATITIVDTIATTVATDANTTTVATDTNTTTVATDTNTTTIATDTNATTIATDTNTTTVATGTNTTTIATDTTTVVAADANTTTVATDTNTTTIATDTNTTTVATDTNTTTVATDTNATTVATDTTTVVAADANTTTVATDTNTTTVATDTNTTTVATDTNATTVATATNTTTVATDTTTAVATDANTTTTAIDTNTTTVGTATSMTTQGTTVLDTTAQENTTFVQTTTPTIDSGTTDSQTTGAITDVTTDVPTTTELTTVTIATTVPTTASTTGPVSTTVAVVVSDVDNNEECNPILYIIIIAVLACLLVGLIIGLLIFCCCPCACCFACARTRRYDVERTDAATLAPGPDETFSSATWRLVVDKEDALKDAMSTGKVSVLEFAIKGARSAGSLSVDAMLLSRADKTLNEWKRTLSLLERAYDSRDILAMEEYMQRFEELDITDESAIYKKCANLQLEVNECIASLAEATQERDEEKLLVAIARFDDLRLLSDYTSGCVELIKAKEILDELKKERLLKGKTQKEMKRVLRDAINRRDVKLIESIIAQIEDAGIPGMEDEIEEGKRMIKEINNELEEMRENSLQHLLDASQARDAKELRDALRKCSEYGIDVAEIREGERLLKLVEREDQLLHQMRELIALGDSAKLLEAIAVFRTPGLQLVDKTGDVERADEALQKIREKERLERAKGDAMWRLQNARNVGDVVVMKGMIKALENLASMGEDIDEAVLLRAKAELETFQGQVDYRKRMEAIKSAILRMSKAENLPQLADLIEQMAELSADVSYTMTADDSRVLDESRAALHDLRRKHAIMDEMDATRPVLYLPQIPDSLEKLSDGVQTMTRLKESAMEFEGVFGQADDDMLTVASMNASELRAKVEQRDAGHERLRVTMENRDYDELIAAIHQAEEAPFMDEEILKDAKDLSFFLDPAARVTALKAAISSRNIGELTLAIEDFKYAKVPGEAVLLEKAERRLAKLIKLQRKQKREEKKRKREEAKRRAEIDALDRLLEAAIASRDREQLQDALEQCENSGYGDTEIPLYVKAEELLDELTIDELREKLIDGIARRDIYTLEDTIDQADYGGYVEELGSDYLSAKDLLFHLRELHRLREAISGMNRSLISEINRYPTPPKPVHTVMTAALLMLGEPLSNLTSWSEVQVLVGKLGNESITRRVRRRAPGDITPEIRNQVEPILRGLDIDIVQEISKGAGAFFAWMTCMLKESYFATASPRREDVAAPSSSSSDTAL